MQTQYEIDTASELAPIFYEVRAMLLKNSGIKEVKKAKITSYFCKDGGICYLRTKKDRLIIGLFQGSRLEEQYGLLAEKAKQIRHLSARKLGEIDEAMFQKIIEDSIICCMERKELAQLRQKLKKKKEES